jgi:nucleoside-diphosphate-sugar epimerase
MKIFIIGATGYIGRAVTEAMLRAGHQVLALARSDEAAAQLSASEITVIRGDLADTEALREGLRQADGVVYLAARGSYGPSPMDSAALETIIVDLAGSEKPLLLTSSLGVYAGIQASTVDEDTPLTHTIPAQAWRLGLEAQVLDAAERGVRSIVIRPAFVYGNGGWSPLLRSVLELARRSGEAIYSGEGTNILPVVHVADLADAYRRALGSAPARTILNVVGGSITGKDLALGISHATGQGGATVSLSQDKVHAVLGGSAAVVALDLKVSSFRATHMLSWTPREPSLLYELLHGSLRIC